MSIHLEYAPTTKYYKLFDVRCIEAIGELIRGIGINESLDVAAQKPRVLDVGCGRGELLQELSNLGFECYGLDVDENCVELSKKYGHVVQCSAEEVDVKFSKNFFNVVILSHVLEHMDNPMEIAKKISYVSSKYIVIAVPNLAEPNLLYGTAVRKFLRSFGREFNPSSINKGHKFGWDPSHLKTFLEYSCGLKILKWKVDRVVIVPAIIPTLLEYVRLRDFLEVRLLPKFFPFWSHSLMGLYHNIVN